MKKEKITKFADIPAFTRDGAWQADFDFKFLLHFIDEHIEEYGLPNVAVKPLASAMGI